MAEATIHGIEVQVSANAGEATKELKRLADTLSRLKSAGGNLGLSKANSEIKNLRSASAKTTSALSKLGAALKRIAMYRLLRSAIRAVTDAFKEGLKNAYEFSKLNGGVLAQSLDTIATKSLTMKNQLGAAFGSLLTTLTPIILQIISLVTKLASVLSMVFSALGGQSQYKKAVDVWTEWGEAAEGAGGAAKKALEYLAPFDELNVLPDPKSGGGGGGSNPDYASMFEYEDIPEWLKSLQGFAQSLKLTFNDVILDWSDLTGEQVVEKVIAGLGGLLGAGLGFMIGGVPGAIVGALVGISLGMTFDTLVFDHDGVLSETEIKNSLRLALNALAGGLIGFTIGGVGGALIGATIGVGLSLAVKGLDIIPGSQGINTNELLSKLTTVMTTVVGGIIGFSVGGPGGALIGAAIGFGLSATLETISFESGGSDGKTAWQRFWNDFLEVPQTIEWVERAITWVGEGIADFFNEFYALITGHDDPQAWGIVADEWAENASEIVNGFLNGIADKFNNFIQWAKTNIFDPIVDGIKSVFGINSPATEMIPLGEMLAEGIKLGIKNAWSNLKNWLITNVYNPLATEWNNLVGEDSRWALPIKAEVEEIDTSSFDTSKAIISGCTASIAKVKDGLTTDQKTVSTIARFTKKADGLTDSKSEYGRQIPTIARFTRKADGLTDSTTQYGRQISTIARFTSQKNALSKDQRTVSTWAKFTSRIQGLTKDQRTFGSWANFTARNQNLTESQRTFTSWANFKSYKNNLGTPSLNSNAYITDYRIDNSIKYSGYLSVGAYLNIKGQTNTPTVTVNAQYTNQTRARGGVFSGGTWHDIPQYAGGTLRAGSMFIAGEAGPEIVGHIGGRTEVLNRSQLASTMYAAIRSAMASSAFRISNAPAASSAGEGSSEDVLYRAFRRALDETDFSGDIDLDGDTVYRAMVRRNRQNTRLTGVNAMA